MSNEKDFSKCPLFKKSSCLGNLAPGTGRFVSAQITWVADGKTHSSDIFDFSKEHDCPLCPEYKKA